MTTTTTTTYTKGDVCRLAWVLYKTSPTPITLSVAMSTAWEHFNPVAQRITAVKQNIDKSAVMQSAWAVKKANNVTFSEALKQAWKMAKREEVVDAFAELKARFEDKMWDMGDEVVWFNSETWSNYGKTRVYFKALLRRGRKNERGDFGYWDCDKCVYVKGKYSF